MNFVGFVTDRLRSVLDAVYPREGAVLPKQAGKGVNMYHEPRSACRGVSF